MDKEDYEQRLLRLERSNRHCKATLLFALIATVGVYIMGASAPPHPIQASEFVLVDAAGRARAILGSNDTSVGLRLLNKNGTAGVGLTAADGANGMFIGDAFGHPRESLTVSSGSADFAFFRQSEARSRLRITDNTAGTVIAFRDAAGHEMVDLGLTNKGSGLAVSDANEIPRALVGEDGFMSLNKGGQLVWSSFGEKLSPKERKQARDFINQLQH
jgi:hypothetical protein